MKKVVKFIGMMCMGAVLILGASSCKKDKTETVSSFDISLPAIEGESGLTDDSKAYIDLTADVMKWYDGDNVMMYSIDENYANSQTMVFVGEAGITGQTYAHFHGYAMKKGSEGYFAFYPASKASTEIRENNRATFNVGDTQTHETDLFASTSYAGRIFMDPRGYVGAATCDIIEPYAMFSMKHIFGYFNVRVKDSSLGAGVNGRYLKSVTITDNTMHLTGSMSVEIPALTSADLDGMKTLGLNYLANGDADAYWSAMNTKLHEIGYMSNPTGNSVTLDCSAANGGAGAPIAKTNKFFFMPLRPGALMGNFMITLKFNDNEGDVVVKVKANKQYISIPGYYTVISIDLAQANGGLVSYE